MNIIDRAEARAKTALAELASQAKREGWDEERLEREKSLFEMRFEVTLCCGPGCLAMVHPIPGFRDLTCPEHSDR